MTINIPCLDTADAGCTQREATLDIVDVFIFCPEFG